MKIETLKQQARAHELEEEWAKALELYRRAAEALEKAEEPDIALLNRMADLQVRNGDLDAAIESYEGVIELYLEADLPNNAIAICRKMIRNAPGRPGIYRRLGGIRAGQGFVVDARQNYLTYAEMMESRGEREKALEGLNELITLIPDDVETRLFLGELLAGRDLAEEGLSHLLHAWKVLKQTGEDERAAEVEERIRAIDDAAIFPDTAPSPEDVFAPTDGVDDGVIGFESTGMESLDEPDVAEAVDFDADFDDDFDDDFGAEADVAADESDEPVEAVGEFEIPEESTDFGEVDLSEDDTAEAGVVDDSLEDPSWSLDDESDLPESTDPLPLLPSDDSFDLDAPEAGAVDAPDDSLEAIRARLAEDPDESDHHQDLVEFAYRVNDRELLLEAFTGLAGALTRTGKEGKARSVYEQVLQLDARNPEALQALGRTAEVHEAEPAPSFEADAFIEPDSVEPSPVSGEGAPDSDLIDPGLVLDDAALDADLSPEEAAPTTASDDSPSTAAPEREAYVDLGSMIMDDEDEEAGTTRWVASGHEPSGDEGMDFASMLSDFKDKVARNLDHEDSRSQYDLGAAYKEMGLIDEAISMFQSALRARPSDLGSIEMMGQCFLEKDEPAMAVRVLSRALGLSHPVEDDLLAIYYYLGEAHERAGNPTEAKEFYEMVFALDINFKDVTDRLRSLR